MITFSTLIFATSSFAAKQIISAGVAAIILAVIGIAAWLFYKNIKESHEYNNVAMPTMAELGLEQDFNAEDDADDDEVGFSDDDLGDDFEDLDDSHGTDSLMNEINEANKQDEASEEEPKKRGLFGSKK